MSKTLLQDIVNENSFDNLPAMWQNFDFKNFSKEKSLFDFQQDALKNVLVVLWKYYDNNDSKINYQEKEKFDINETRKEEFFQFYTTFPNFPEKNLDYNLENKEGKITAKLLEEYYPVKDNKVSFVNFINRMAFWMATGSGKTLVIVKIIEILKKLIERKEIPENDILFLTHREDLLDQFKEYIREFNSSNSNDISINLKSLKDYDSVKRENQSLFKEKEITIFYYRSDLISDESKEKLVNFRNYDNDGQWYILLDEAHKGDKEDSKRQVIYSILSRNGFLFNFSATFTDLRDQITTGFDFKLNNFIDAGYGKYIYLSEEEIKAFKDKEDFSEKEKQKIVLKSLILLTYIKKFADKIKKAQKNLYHYPLLLTLVNSVNVEDADLKLFFQEIEKIGRGKVDKEFFNSVKNELIESLNFDNKILMPQNEELIIDEKSLREITFKDVLLSVYNSKGPGNIEVLTIPGNKQEMIFKLRTSASPFALIKIGEIKPWLDWFEELGGYEINESFSNESIFKKINKDDSDINILMGSRSFYEGWDSNRPNIILFINIGVGVKAKKFVLQSTGRGLRIEPIKNERKRLSFLYLAGKIKQNLYKKIKDYVPSLETLFIFGTNKNALNDTFTTLIEERGEEYPLERQFVINEKAKELPLFVPVYKPAPYILADKGKGKQIKYFLAKEDFDLVKSYFEYFDDKRVLLMQYEIEPKILKTIDKSFKESLDYYKTEEGSAILNPEIILSRIINHFSLIPEEFKAFEKVEKGKFIVHFEKVKYFGREKLNEFLEKFNKVKIYEEKEKEIKQSKLPLDTQKEILDEMKERSFDGIKIKYIPNHYYYPIILSEQKYKIEYLNHIIKEESEVKFIKELDKYLAQDNNLFDTKFEWWLFSKLDENTDDVYIPWNNQKSNKFERFKPDFIFWMKEKGSKNYFIVFIDPKGTEHTEAYRKIDGFKEIFEGKLFPPYDSFNIKVKLFCKPSDQALAEKEYKEYWYDNIQGILRAIIN